MRKKIIDTSKISPQGMVSTTNQMTTPKTQTNFASSKLGNVSSGKKNYHPRENKKYFLSNKGSKPYMKRYYFETLPHVTNNWNIKKVLVLCRSFSGKMSHQVSVAPS